MAKRLHQHDGTCRYRELTPLRAWRLHLRNFGIGMLVGTIALYAFAAWVGSWFR